MQLRDGKEWRNTTRMGSPAFEKLCDMLRNGDHLKDIQWSPIEEQVAKCFHISAHNVKNHTISFFFHCLGETITR